MGIQVPYKRESGTGDGAAGTWEDFFKFPLISQPCLVRKPLQGTKVLSGVVADLKHKDSKLTLKLAHVLFTSFTAVPLPRPPPFSLPKQNLLYPKGAGEGKTDSVIRRIDALLAPVGAKYR